MRVVAVVALLAALALVAGCGDDEETTTTSAPTAETTTEDETTTTPTAGDEEEGEDEAPDGGGAPAEAPGDDPETALEAFFTSGDPDLVCGELATDKALTSAYGDEKGCRQAQVPAATPDAIDIKSLDVSGDEATATVIPDGGPNDGIETEVTLENEGGSWLVDSLKADVPAGP